MRNAVSQAVSAVSRGIGSVRRCGVRSIRAAGLLADFGEDGIFALRADALTNYSAVFSSSGPPLRRLQRRADRDKVPFRGLLGNRPRTISEARGVANLPHLVADILV